MYLSPTARLAIYAQGEFGKGHSKTAEGVIRYAKNPIAAVIDSTAVGKTILETVGIDCPAPIVPSVTASLAHKPDALLLGTAWTGGALPKAWREDIKTALQSGLDVVNGLHDFLSDDEEIATLAAQLNRRLLDVRRPPDKLPVGAGLARTVKPFVVLTVGTDCAVGKMTASLELTKEAERRGYQAEFIATGQTGIMITGGFGVAIDRVIGDFMAGAMEKLVLETSPAADFVFVEGQGSLAHPGFSGVTLSLMHGAAPKAMIMCTKADLKIICELEDFPLPDLNRMIAVSESMASFVQPSRVVAIAVNTYGLTDQEAKATIQRMAKETNLPCTDPVRYGVGPLFDAVLEYRSKSSENKTQPHHTRV